MLLELKDVSYTYRQFGLGKKSNEPSLSGVNLRIENSKIISVVGSNGAGKTTLLNLLASLTKPSSGHINKEGVESVSFIRQLDGEIAWMPITVAEIIKMSSYRKRGYLRRIQPIDEEKMQSAVERMEIQELLGQQFNDLSKGQRQRVKISLALAQEPDLLIMDEPMNGLDILSQERIQKIVQEEKLRGAAIVIATHSLEEAAQADETILLDKKVVAQGEPHETLTEDNLRSVYKDNLRVLSDDKLIVVDHH